MDFGISSFSVERKGVGFVSLENNNLLFLNFIFLSGLLKKCKFFIIKYAFSFATWCMSIVTHDNLNCPIISIFYSNLFVYLFMLYGCYSFSLPKMLLYILF